MYKDMKVLDVHGHVSVPQAANAPLLFMLGSNTPIDDWSGSVIPAPPEEQFHAAAQRHVSYLDERKIDVQIIGPRPFLMLGWMEDHLLPSWTSNVNDNIHRQCEFFPDRFLGACQLPQISDAPDTSHCLPELDRCVGEYGFVATYVSPDPAGRRTTPGMHEAYWYPLYERCQDLDIPLIVHGTNSLDRRYRVVPHNYQLGFLTEQYLAGQFLGHGDVFERFPALRVIICHCGGALNRFIPTDHHLAQKDLSGNLFYDTCGYDEHFLSAAIHQRGVSQMCFGTEAPGSGRAVRPETGRTSDDLVPVIDAFDFLSEEDKRTIFHANPLKVVPGLAKLA
ncbi:amidohydrolase family protein [Amycolatopsis pigmentata]|uniref:Amidohydrolase family protein n=1 Tax=Amycolatopsis pigmentata TaxID=450801 RepID=A0ABW5FKK4_9PSEU